MRAEKHQGKEGKRRSIKVCLGFKWGNISRYDLTKAFLYQQGTTLGIPVGCSAIMSYGTKEEQNEIKKAIKRT